MTMMTALHFASPFAFSMPAPAQPVTRPVVGALPSPVERGGDAANSAGRADAASAPFEDAAAETGSEGFAASPLDAALRRYLEQQSARPGPEPAGRDPGDDVTA